MANNPGCAACRHQRRKCPEDCPLPPYFPHDSLHFPTIHKMFGVSNVKKKLAEVAIGNREHVAQSIKWEGLGWARDPVHGPLGLCRRLMHQKHGVEHQLRTSEAQVEQAKKENNDLALKNFELEHQLRELEARREQQTKDNYDLALKKQELEYQLLAMKDKLEIEKKHNHDLTLLKNSQLWPYHTGPIENGNGSIDNPSIGTGASKCGSNGVSADNLLTRQQALMQGGEGSQVAGFTHSRLPQRLGISDEIINGAGQIIIEQGLDTEELLGAQNEGNINHMVEPEKNNSYYPDIWLDGEEWNYDGMVINNLGEANNM